MNELYAGTDRVWEGALAHYWTPSPDGSMNNREGSYSRRFANRAFRLPRRRRVALRVRPRRVTAGDDGRFDTIETHWICEIVPQEVWNDRLDQLYAGMPVRSSPRISVWISWVPSYV
ncbi:hypothetical protein D8S78_22265 [Natrialba swarupiae]|nr:hypothetical protein [Natrialba swarupiae]